jgi:hypothetical protein
MAKWQNDLILDAAIAYITANVTQETVCSAQPTTYAEATTTYDGGASKYCLAKKTGLTSGSFTGPANGDINGRKITVNQQAAITVDASANATHIALCSGSVLIYVTTCTSQALTAGNTVTVPVWDIEFADVTP